MIWGRVLVACLRLSLLDLLSFFILFFKQKTAYEMRISDWSSDVCSSDLFRALPASPAEASFQPPSVLPRPSVEPSLGKDKEGTGRFTGSECIAAIGEGERACGTFALGAKRKALMAEVAYEDEIGRAHV